MYCNFFGFSEKPFDVTPDPRFLYLTEDHREALASLMYGIHERRGVIAIVGEVGTGKTTLLNTVLGRLDKEVRVAFIINTNMIFDELLTMALLDLKLATPDETLTRVEAVWRLNDFAIQQLSGGGNVVLLVDEAQNLDPSAMENLRLLSNLETPKHKLIQIVLSGQPELDTKLSQPQLRQLTQRISLKRYITPLCEEETYDYIRHRLSVAGYSGPTLFDRRAQQLIWEYSRGVPRKINILCDNALLIGYALRHKTIDASVIEEAIKDLSWSPFFGSPDALARTPIQSHHERPDKTSRSRFVKAAGLVLAACVLFFVGLVLGSSRFQPQASTPLPPSAKIPAETSSQPYGSGLETVVEPFPGLQKFDASAGVENEKGMANPEPSPSETSGSANGESRFVVAREGDNLFWIIKDAYGRYNVDVLNAVLRENPEIENPDRITAGQLIRLPAEE